MQHFYIVWDVFSPINSQFCFVLQNSVSCSRFLCFKTSDDEIKSNKFLRIYCEEAQPTKSAVAGRIGQNPS